MCSEQFRGYFYVIRNLSGILRGKVILQVASSQMRQERKFLEFIKNDEHYKRYYDGMFILFKTGLRISEFCGLTLSDIDFEEKQISVNHQLQRTRGMKYIIEDTKTSSGTRIIPMTEEVYECFKRVVENRKKHKKEPVIDGYKGFLLFG